MSVSEGHRVGDEAPRPPPEDVYGRLDDLFPHNGLDRPVIGGSSGSTTPTNEQRGMYITTGRGDPATSTSLRARMRTQVGALPSTIADQASSRHAGPATSFKYIRGELIDHGRYACVYLALNAMTGEMLAVKQVELPQASGGDSDGTQSLAAQVLKAESEILKELDHPHIVQYLGFEETPTVLSLFLEYAPGGTLGGVLKEHGMFDDVVTRVFSWQILDGLEYLHSKGIMHRSLESANILVDMKGVCKISDFGIATKKTGGIQKGAQHIALQGTIFWMAPEIINTQIGCSIKSDIWSVGCIVLEMWGGMRPWIGEEMVAVMFKLYQNELPPLLPGMRLSDRAMDFKLQCFTINPEKRPSASQLKGHPYLEVPPGWQFKGFIACDYPAMDT